MNPDIVLMLTIPGMLVSIFWIVFSNIRRQKIARVQAEFHVKLLEKFGSSHELLAYIETEAGRRFLESATIEQIRSNPFGRILSSVQAGLILLLLGIALIFLTRPVPDAAQPLVVFGTLAVTLGIAFLLSAGASYRLSKSFGLLESAPSRRQ